MSRDEDVAYELVFSPDGSGEEGGDEDVVVVHPTGATGPGGHPVYSDDSGIIRAEISDRGEVRMLATGGHQAAARPTVRRHTGG